MEILTYDILAHPEAVYSAQQACDIIKHEVKPQKLQYKYYAKIPIDDLQIPEEYEDFQSESFCENLIRLKGIYNLEGYPVFVTNLPLSGNLFWQAWHKKAAVITMGDWRGYYAPPDVPVYLIYVLAQIATYFHFDLGNHEETRGCLLDYCKYKLEIKKGMRAASFCDDCYDKIRTVISSETNKENILVDIKKLAKWVQTQVPSPRV